MYDVDVRGGLVVRVHSTLMAGGDVNQLPVVQNGTLVGILSRDAIIQYLEVRRGLGIDTTKSDAQNRLRNAA